MIYRIKITSAFKKSYKRAKKRGLNTDLLDGIIDKLRRGIALEDKYRDHSLTGNFIGFRECHIQPDWILLYMIENDILTLTLADAGTHSDIFG